MSELRTDRGTSMTEMVVVMAITALLALPLIAILGTTTRVEQSQASGSDARADLDWALTLLAADIKSGTPTERPRVGSRMSSTLPLSIIDERGVEELIHWRVGPSGLERITYNPATLRERDRSLVVAAVGEGSESAFTYLDASGSALDPTTTPAGIVTDCTTLIRITLTAPASDRILTATRNVAIRARAPGGNGC